MSGRGQPDLHNHPLTKSQYDNRQYIINKRKTNE